MLGINYRRSLSYWENVQLCMNSFIFNMPPHSPLSFKNKKCTRLPWCRNLTSVYKNKGNKDWTLDHMVVKALIACHKLTIPKAVKSTYSKKVRVSLSDTNLILTCIWYIPICIQKVSINIFVLFFKFPNKALTLHG